MRGKRGFVACDRVGDRLRVPRQEQQLKVERKMHAASRRSVVGDEPLDGKIDFSYEQTIRIRIRERAHFGDDVVYFRTIRVVHREHDVVRRHCRDVRRIGGIVAKLAVFHDFIDDIDAESIDSAVKPETHRVEHRLPYVSVPPVQIRLLGKEGVVVVLARSVVESPRLAAEVAEPVEARCRRLSDRATDTSRVSHCRASRATR